MSVKESQLCRRSFIEIIEQEFDDNVNVRNIITHLFNRGVLLEEHALRLIIKREYFQMAKRNRISYFRIKMILSEKYGVSQSYIEKCIYYYKGIN